MGVRFGLRFLAPGATEGDCSWLDTGPLPIRPE